MSEYAERDIIKLDERGGHYLRHVSAMTREGLHSKSAIAAELAYRDAELEVARAIVRKLVDVPRGYGEHGWTEFDKAVAAARAWLAKGGGNG